jgi:NADP-dependent 3-hydroxy acid dehydrogenase YdfG
MAVDLDGAVVCVTGAARGIGRATAAEFVARGAKVWIGDLDAAEAAEAARELGKRARAQELDVTDSASFAAFLKAAGKVDVLVNNAGIMPLGAFLDEDPRTGDRTIDVNLRGVVYGMRLALPAMVKRGSGHVVNVASMMGKLPIPGAAVYTATKFAVVGMTASVREEIAGSGVTLTVVLPSLVRTELVAGVPLGRGLPAVDAEDVAGAIVASCSNGRREVYVPRWMGAYDVVDGAVPTPLMGVVRRLLAHDRVLSQLDAEARSDYDRRSKPS